MSVCGSVVKGYMLPFFILWMNPIADIGHNFINYINLVANFIRSISWAALWFSFSSDFRGTPFIFSRVTHCELFLSFPRFRFLNFHLIAIAS